MAKSLKISKIKGCSSPQSHTFLSVNIKFYLWQEKDRNGGSIHLRRKGIKKCETENRSPPLSRLKLSSRSPVYLIKQREEKGRRITVTTKKNNKKRQNRSPPLSRLKMSSRSPVHVIKQREEKEGDGGSLLRQKKNKKGKTVALDLYSIFYLKI
jgi:hypothetical protein